MESNLIKIRIDIYRSCNNLSKFGTDFQNTIYFDQECGLRYNSDESPKEAGYFYFDVIDQHKYFLGKIKYGI